MIETRTLMCLAALCTLLLPGCFGRKTPPAETDSQHVAMLKKEIKTLRDQLYARSRGAYRTGPSLTLDERRKSTTLEALHELENELKDTKSILKERNQHITVQARQIEEIREINAVQKREIILLEKERKAKVITQHALQAAQKEISTLKLQLATSEHKRLDIEKSFAEFATRFLKLRALDTKQFTDLQRSLRDRLLRFVEDETDKEVSNARN